MDFGLLILPPFASQRAGVYFGQGRFTQQSGTKQDAKDRRKLTGLLKFASDVRRDHQPPLAMAAPGGNVVD
jgi:hypothetical protein